MATKKKYESMRIMSLEGSVLYKNEGFTATKDGKPDPQAFRGILDESLDIHHPRKHAGLLPRHGKKSSQALHRGQADLVADHGRYAEIL